MDILSRIFDFIGYFLACVIMFSLPAYLSQRFKVVGAITLVLFSSGAGFAVATARADDFSDVFGNFVVTSIIVGMVYGSFTKIVQAKRNYGNSKVLDKTISKSSFFIYMGIIVSTFGFFYIEPVDWEFYYKIIITTVFLQLSDNNIKNFEKTLIEINKFIEDNKCVVIEQIAEQFKTKKLFSTKNDIKFKNELYELLWFLSVKYKKYYFVYTRKNSEQALFIDFDLYYSLHKYFDSLVMTKTIIPVSEVMQFIYSKTNKPVDSKAISYFVNFEKCGYWCYDNVLIENNLSNEIGKNIKKSLENGTFQVNDYINKYGISIFALSELANRYNCNIKIV